MLTQAIARNLLLKHKYGFSTIPKWATCDPYTLSESKPYTLQNLVSGKWKDAKEYTTVVDPMNGDKFLRVPDTKGDEINEFIVNAKKVPKSGLHNPIKNPERYQLYGNVCGKIAEEMKKPEIESFLCKATQRVMPKSDVQIKGEIVVTRRFFENFAGDNPRFLCRSFNVAGDHQGQQSSGYRWPYGSVALIAPFNFPIEIPCLQLFGCLIAGNRPTLKIDSKVSLVMEQFLRLAIDCGMPAEDVDLIHSGPQAMEKIILDTNYRVIQFTGSSTVAERLSKLTHGKVKIEDAGFDWKILGPDVSDIDYVAWQCDQDAYAASGQKCSAQSILYAHENWMKAGFVDKIKSLAARRKLSDLTVGPVLTWDNQKIKNHIDSILALPGAKVLFGGKPLTNHSIPSIYGSYEPTAIFVPLETISKNFDIVCKELFGPFQIVTEYKDNQLDTVLSHLEKMENHLTAAVVSNDVKFLNYVTSNTVNGVTYTGIRARTTGAPQNHWFGPCGDPRGAGIGTPEAILSVWTSHREIITDIDIPKNWKVPQAS
ncbi:delta-1-pyrroline-5-carboxylate dehydrogenase (macronuclear) [Tetrahymena thermophila SB210]|uniref:Delta-1-pyrroline-5-carboxylate dehydrogenase n=1 Tax=Tetrahymena thermophila (strain SB210) TaxID=312017 RepID=Q22EZ7_TETTS|nr:delta-1-pyrroline-5-carboxylate dehydrogenase [Tetrahymena thermophila SB210]EAR83878.1 delta-1-pyrroline-5-carboxylate dehydrogenase [Tetrahymena thermophila SB210]|eukprot:XP_001031541.1 delta-1-pyrroline-5-carboxylate dehydrogenase [Tetrahymena thermophila SB210]